MLHVPVLLDAVKWLFLSCVSRIPCESLVAFDRCFYGLGKCGAHGSHDETHDAQGLRGRPVLPLVACDEAYRCYGSELSDMPCTSTPCRALHVCRTLFKSVKVSHAFLGALCEPLLLSGQPPLSALPHLCSAFPKCFGIKYRSI